MSPFIYASLAAFIDTRRGLTAEPRHCHDASCMHMRCSFSGTNFIGGTRAYRYLADFASVERRWTLVRTERPFLDKYGMSCKTGSK